MRAVQRLSAGFVGGNVPEGKHADGGGLYLVRKNGGTSWILRYEFEGNERFLGLGPLHDVGLADARKLAAEARAKIRAVVDPVQERKDTRAALRAERAAAVTFEQATKRYLDFKLAEFKNPKHKQQWQNTLKTYAFPVIAKQPIKAITTEIIQRILDPIWMTKNETATRLRQRIEAVLDSAFAKMTPRPENPARWSGHLDTMFLKPSKVRKVKNY